MVAKRMKASLINKLLMRSCFSKKVSQMYLHCKKCEVTFSISITRVVTKVIIFFVKSKLLFCGYLQIFGPLLELYFQENTHYFLENYLVNCILFIKSKLLFCRYLQIFGPLLELHCQEKRAILFRKLSCKLHIFYQKQSTILQIFANLWSFVRITFLGEASTTSWKIIFQIDEESEL